MNYYDGFKEDFYSLIVKISKDSDNLRDVLLIEKDLIQWLFLYELSKINRSIVFKGGTSLSKAYKIINRFLEDIDLSFDYKPTQSEKRKIYESIIKIAKSLNLRLVNSDNVKSRYDYNKYIFEYGSLFVEGVLTIIVETSFYCPSYPIIYREINSYLNEYLSKNNKQVDFVNVRTFPMKVQSLERTFIDKIFAISDYYLMKKSVRESKHLYDLYKIFASIKFDDSFKELIRNVKKDNSVIKNNPAANSGVNIHNILKEIVSSNFYKSDYENITKTLLYEDVSYKNCIENCINKVIESKVFDF